MNPLYVKQQDMNQPQDQVLQGQCHICSSPKTIIQCEACRNLYFCNECYQVYHSHPKRRRHLVTRSNDSSVIRQTEQNGHNERSTDMVSLESQPEGWKCEFCTYENSNDHRICEVCCKTPTKQRKLTSDDPTGATSTTSNKWSIPAIGKLNLNDQRAPTEDAATLPKNGLSLSTPKLNRTESQVVDQQALRTWTCFHCTYINTANHRVCQVCSRTTGNLQRSTASVNAAPVAQQTGPPMTANTSRSSFGSDLADKEKLSSIQRHWATPGRRPISEQWKCEKCNYINSGKARICNICGKASTKYLSLPANLTSASTSTPIKFNEKIIRRLQGEHDIARKDRAILVFELMQRGHSEIAAVKACRECSNLTDAEEFLKDFNRKEGEPLNSDSCLPSPEKCQSLPITLNGYDWPDKHDKVQDEMNHRTQNQLPSEPSTPSDKLSKLEPLKNSNKTVTQNKTYADILKDPQLESKVNTSEEQGKDVQPQNDSPAERVTNKKNLKSSISPKETKTEENVNGQRHSIGNSKESPQQSMAHSNISPDTNHSSSKPTTKKIESEENNNSVNGKHIVEVHHTRVPSAKTRKSDTVKDAGNKHNNTHWTLSSSVKNTPASDIKSQPQTISRQNSKRAESKKNYQPSEAEHGEKQSSVTSEDSGSPMQTHKTSGDKMDMKPGNQDTGRDTATNKNVTEALDTIEVLSSAPNDELINKEVQCEQTFTSSRKKKRHRRRNSILGGKKNQDTKRSASHQPHDTSYDVQSVASNRSSRRQSSNGGKNKGSGSLLSCFIL